MNPPNNNSASDIEPEMMDGTVRPGSEQKMAGLKEQVSDPLLDCIVALSAIKGRPLSHESLRAGTPLENSRFTPSIMTRALKREGFSSKVVKKSIDQLSKFVLPVVLILKNDKACILSSKTAEGKFNVMFPDDIEHNLVMSEAEVKKLYSGYCMYAQPKFQYEERAFIAHEIDKKSWFWSTLWRFKGVYFEVMVATFLVNIFGTITPLFAMNVYDRVVPNQAYNTLWVLAIGISIIYILSFLTDTLREFFTDLAGKKIDIILTTTLFEKVLNTRMEHRPKSIGSFANMIKEFDSLRNFFSSATMTAFIDIPFTVIFLYVIWVIGGNLVYIPIIAMPIVLILALIHEWPMKRTMQKMYTAGAQKNATLIETLMGLETIKSLAAEGPIQRKYEENVSVFSKESQKVSLISSSTKNLTKTILQFVYVAIIVMGVYQIGAGELTMGGLIACSILSNRTIAPLSKAASLLGKLHQTMTSYQGLNRIMQLPDEREQGRQYISIPHLKGDIEFDKVTFTYPGEQKPLFENVSFSIKQGEKVAILGANGCGKTTILKLLTDMYRPTEGSIRIDGIDIQHINPSELRQHVGYLAQDYTLFYGSLRENLTMSAPWLGDENMLKVAGMTGVDKLISGHEGGYEMPINENGVGLSGGQRQSIAIARTLFPNRNILLLDEPTSALDMQAEHKILQELKDYCKDKTLLLVTHRVTLLDLVDRVIVVDGGKIKYDGPKK